MVLKFTHQVKIHPSNTNDSNSSYSLFVSTDCYTKINTNILFL